MFVKTDINVGDKFMVPAWLDASYQVITVHGDCGVEICGQTHKVPTGPHSFRTLEAYGAQWYCVLDYYMNDGYIRR